MGRKSLYVPQKTKKKKENWEREDMDTAKQRKLKLNLPCRLVL